jgi:uncharacterized protein
MDLPRDITLFGGEPLLAESRPIIEYIINKAQSLGKARISAITNGTELEAYKDLLGPEKIYHLQITIDGITSEHDQRRIYADGSGSFAKIAKNLTMALDLGVIVSVRLNIDRNNIQQLPKLADEMINRGWSNYKNFSAYTSPVYASNENTSLKTTFNSWELTQVLDKMLQEYPQLTVINRKSDGLISLAREILETESDAVSTFNASFCSAHTKMYIFDPFGDIYACWEKTGDQKIRIGNITENSEVILNEELNQTWRNRTVVNNPVCRKCRYAFACGGGCAVLAMTNKGKFHTNYCDGFAHRFRASVATAYQDYVAGIEVESKPEELCRV